MILASLQALARIHFSVELYLDYTTIAGKWKWFLAGKAEKSRQPFAGSSYSQTVVP
jgi:hypothetical protein